MAKDIFQRLSKLDKIVSMGAWKDLEIFTDNELIATTNKKLIKEISGIDLSAYVRGIKNGLLRAFQKAEAEHCIAVYFEYDMDNNWSGNFFMYTVYWPSKRHNDEWAAHWDHTIEGPAFSEFATMFEKYNGFSDDGIAAQVTAYLIGKTALAFRKAYAGLTANDAISVCIGFHDQDPVWRVFEPTIIPRIKKARKRLPLKAENDFIEDRSGFKFDELYQLTQGVALAKKDGAYGYVDKNGGTVLPFKFRRASSFSDGLAAVSIDGRIGYIDTKGETVIEPRFEDALRFIHGGAPAKLAGKWGIIDKNGAWLHAPVFTRIMQSEEPSTNPDIFINSSPERFGYITSKGEVIVQFESADINDKVTHFNEGLAGIVLADEYGYIDVNGNWKIHFKKKASDSVIPNAFHCGIAAVLMPCEFTYINTSGAIILGGCEFCWEFSEGFGVFKPLDRKENNGIVDAKGAILFTLGRKKWKTSEGYYVDLNIENRSAVFTEGFIIGLSKETKETCVLNKEGIVCAKMPYSIENFHYSSAVIHESYKRFGYINNNFNLISGFDYTSAEPFDANRIAITRKEGNFGFVERIINT